MRRGCSLHWGHGEHARPADVAAVACEACQQASHAHLTVPHQSPPPSSRARALCRAGTTSSRTLDGPPSPTCLVPTTPHHPWTTHLVEHELGASSRCEEGAPGQAIDDAAEPPPGLQAVLALLPTSQLQPNIAQQGAYSTTTEKSKTNSEQVHKSNSKNKTRHTSLAWPMSSASPT